jgi:hypothetical protein
LPEKNKFQLKSWKVSAANEGASKECYVILWTTYAFASFRLLAMHHAVDGFKKPKKKAVKNQQKYSAAV